MIFDIQHTEHYSLLKINTGKLDTEIAPDLKSKIIVLTSEEPGKALILDLEEVKFADSRGLSALLLAYRLYRDAGQQLILCNIGERIQKLIDISQLSSTFTIAQDISAAEHLLKSIR